MLNWLDLTITGIFVLVIFLAARRGFGRAAFDLLALFAAMRLAPIVQTRMHDVLQFSENQWTNQAIIYVSAFIIIGGVLVFVGKLIYDSTLISADTFDTLLGFVLGVGMSMILAHVLVRALDIGPGTHSAISGSVFAAEFISFDTYHRILEVLYTLGQ